MTDEEVEKIIKRNMNLQMNLAGIRADFEEASQRQWVGLTDEEAILLIENDGIGRGELINLVEAKLKEKNT
jgi:hypothetical protein